MKKLILFCFLFYLLSSCSKDCKQPGIGVWFFPFDSTAESIIIVKKYQRNSNFSKLIDTVIYSDAKKFDSSYYTQHVTDTFYYGNISISTDFDWMFVFPVSGRSHTISNIGFGRETQSTFLSGMDTKNVYQCYTSTSYYYDGRDTNLPAPGPTNTQSYMNSGYTAIPVAP